MLLGIVYCFLALLWADTAFMLAYCRHVCLDIISKPVSFLLVCSVIASVVECVLFIGMGVAMIAGCS